MLYFLVDQVTDHSQNNPLYFGVSTILTGSGTLVSSIKGTKNNATIVAKPPLPADTNKDSHTYTSLMQRDANHPYASVSAVNPHTASPTECNSPLSEDDKHHYEHIPAQLTATRTEEETAAMQHPPQMVVTTATSTQAPGNYNHLVHNFGNTQSSALASSSYNHLEEQRTGNRLSRHTTPSTLESLANSRQTTPSSEENPYVVEPGPAAPPTASSSNNNRDELFTILPPPEELRRMMAEETS